MAEKGGRAQSPFFPVGLPGATPITGQFLLMQEGLHMAGGHNKVD